MEPPSPPPPSPSWGERLRVLRRAAGLSQRQLADAAGLSPAMVRDLEQGRTRRPRPESVESLIRALAITGPAATALRSATEEPIAPAPAVRTDGPVRIAVLGPLLVTRGDVEVGVGRSARRTVLGRLAVSPGQTVPIDELVDLVWGEHLPKEPTVLLQAHVSRLRGVARIRFDGSGYRLLADTDGVDLLDFRAQVRGRGTQDAQRLEGLEYALGLWRGAVLGDLPALREHALARAVAQERIAAALEHADLAVRLDQPERSIAVLRELTAAEPLHEALHARLMTALDAGGDTAEAFASFAAIRDRLADELGVDPGHELTEAQRAILRPEADPQPLRVPAQLPPAVEPFVGRKRALHRLDRYVAGVVAITGTAGIGKTTLALGWAHRAIRSFPDGQLFVDLRGYDARAAPADPADVLRGFLVALGVRPERLPPDPAQLTGLYRKLMTGRRMLVLLDNAAGADHVRPLLPNDENCTVVVTSRNRLAGLVATDGARPLPLELFSEAEAHELLAGRIESAELNSAPDATAAVIGACAGLPLALAVAASRVATDPGLGLAGLAAQLGAATADSRLTALAIADPVADLRTVLHGSYRALAEPAARMFRLLGLHPGLEIALSTAASLAGVSAGQAHTLLRELAEAGLLGERGDRYAFHDLIRIFARELTGNHDPLDERRAAWHRLADHYLRAGDAAGRLRQPHRAGFELPPPLCGVTVPEFADADDATAFLEAEWIAMAATVHDIAVPFFPQTVQPLVWALATYLVYTEHWPEAVALQQAALEVARRFGDRAGEVDVLVDLSTLAIRQGRTADAVDDAEQAVRRAAETDVPMQARATLAAAWALDSDDRPGDALPYALAALDGYRRLGRPMGQAHALNGIGWCYGRLGDHERTLTYSTQALELYRELSSQRGEAAALDSIGRAHHRLGRPEDAIAFFEAALRLDEQVADRPNQAETLEHLAEALAELGRDDEARAAQLRAWTILDALHHPGADALAARLSGSNA